METLSRRAFSSHRHREGRWKTRAVFTNSSLVRWFGRFTSLKRRGVDELARSTRPGSRVLDIGGGSGAYALWFLGRTPCTVVTVDWSEIALRAIPPPPRGKIFRVCADARALPFKPGAFDRVYSIDTLGHVSKVERVLDETLRVCAPGTRLFLHSECSDYRDRWPDRMLIHRLGKDLPAESDGHFDLHRSTRLYHLYARRFRTGRFLAPAGVLGWLLGYPEKYLPAFRRAGPRWACCCTRLFALVKRMPVPGILLRSANALTNHIEVFLGLTGGGSCFAELSVHGDPDPENTEAPA